MASALQATNATLTAILSTIQTVANTSQRSINTLASGLDMLDTYVDGARTRQVDKHVIDKANYRQQLINDASIDEARRLVQLAAELKSSAGLEAAFHQEHQRISALFAQPVAP